ncbi:MAG: Hpt domain-containing protein [Rubrivivax sp.]|nr:Hpt domain-containing protein [Rubrivivax sp.]
MSAAVDRAAFAELQATAGADFAAELVQTFAEEGPKLLVELHAALAAGSADRFRRAAHSLKSNGHTFGAPRLAELAHALEIGGLPADAAPVQALAAEFAATLPALRALADADGASGAARG